MARSAKRPEPRAPEYGMARLAAGTVGGLVARNPLFVGGATAFLVALSFVSANALWYQPHRHSGAFFATRDYTGGLQEPRQTVIRIERSSEAKPRPVADPALEQVQTVLKELGYYDGEVDGLSGPATRRAIETYQSKMGLLASGKVDAELLDHLGAGPTTAGIAPVPTPREAPVFDEPVDMDEAVEATPAVATVADERIRRIQAGLRAFGNDDIEIDGVAGSRTRGAIREFQAIFGLSETGEPDEVLEAKMREAGLVN